MFARIETFYEDNLWKNRRSSEGQVFAVFESRAEAMLAANEAGGAGPARADEGLEGHRWEEEGGEDEEDGGRKWSG